MSMRTSSPKRLSPLLEPRSVAVIGPSDTPGNLGARALSFLKKFGFPGPVWPVNPRRDTVAGLCCFHSPAELPEAADLAILAVSAAATQAAVQACIDAGIRHGVLWAGGFAETGGEGLARQQALTALCRESGFALCGPNTIGIINCWLPLTATFASSLLALDSLKPGNVSIVSQSGGTAINAQALVQQAGSGCRVVIGAGNEAVLGVSDYLRMVADDPHTKVLAMYLEGARDGADFIAALDQVRAMGKPVVILKAGAAEAGAQAAAAHTGALTGEDRVWRAILREHGVIMVRSLRELVDVSAFLSSKADSTPAGRRVALVTLGGVGSAVALDVCRRNGLTAPPLAPATRERLARLLPASARLGNPIVLGSETCRPERLPALGNALETIASDPGIDALVFEDAYNAATRAWPLAGVADTLVAFSQRCAKPVAISWNPGPDASARLAAAGIVRFGEPVGAIETLAKVLVPNVLQGAQAGTPAALQFDWQRAVPETRAGLVVAEHDCHAILAAAGLPVARAGLATSAEDAVRIAAEIAFPVAMKGITPAITHRAASGLLALGIATEEDVRASYARLSRRAAELGVALEGIYVQHMETGSAEFLVAAFRDPIFGVMVTCGAGGTATELLDDVVIARAPLSEAQAADSLARLRLAQSLPGLAGGIGPLAAFVSHFSRLAATAPWRKFSLEVNPVKWREGGVVAVDGLLVIEEA